MNSTAPAAPFAANQSPSAAIVEAIALHLVTDAAERNPSRERRDCGWGDYDTAASRAYTAVLWSDETKAVRDFSDGFDPADDATNALATVNRLPPSISFEIGFTLALQIGARIALDLLSPHDVSDLLTAARVQYAADLRWHREEGVLAERRFAATRAAQSVLDEFNEAVRENRGDKIAEFVNLARAEMHRRGMSDEQIRALVEKSRGATVVSHG